MHVRFDRYDWSIFAGAFAAECFLFFQAPPVPLAAKIAIDAAVGLAAWGAVLWRHR